jgi:hypothetical protein
LKQYIQEIYDENEHDGFIFLLDEKEMLDVSAFTYKEDSVPIETHPELGLKYHVIIYREGIDGEIFEPDMFEAILGDPHYYAAHLIDIGFFGTICKKTKGSLKIVNEMFKDLLETVQEYELVNEQTT